MRRSRDRRKVIKTVTMFRLRTTLVQFNTYDKVTLDVPVYEDCYRLGSAVPARTPVGETSNWIN